MFKKGDLVLIIGTDNSGPVNEMYNMVGKRFKIEKILRDKYYGIKGYSWNYRDLKKVEIINPPSEPVIFDINNLIFGK